MEFEEKPVFPPPFIFFSHVHRAFKYFYRNWKRRPLIYGHGLKRFLAGENLERIHDFEEECVDAYMKRNELKTTMSTEERVRVINERTETLWQRLEDMHNKVMMKEGFFPLCTAAVIFSFQPKFLSTFIFAISKT